MKIHATIRRFAISSWPLLLLVGLTGRAVLAQSTEKAGWHGEAEVGGWAASGASCRSGYGPISGGRYP
ncbi:hypothetical protein [Spirosoma rhododendri]|uniref:Uncharacterized protein n=1 Tax=Spirosoma rhododendri TaxID=2728024 RepID=A0A7L5DGE2_9BACT|nr:hypothetical protein [Spirosoma rhododendri]QJD77306.1 hypothetical protein HH216_01875 [Spirosoma rhododendri]